MKRLFESRQNFATPQERASAIAYLMAELSPEILGAVHDFMHSEEWPHHFHLGFGTEVRNLLRQQFNWDDHLLDTEWVSLVEATARKFVEELDQNGEIR